MSTKYAIIETGSKQYIVEAQAILEVEKLPLSSENSNEIILDKVLFARNEDRVEFGTPTIKGAQVICEHLGDIQSKKVIILKYRRRKNSRRKRGYRQQLTRLRVKEIKF